MVSSTITDRQLQEYRERGYLHLPGYMSRDQVAAVRREALDVFLQQLLMRGLVANAQASNDEIEDGMARLFRDDLTVFMNCGKQAQHLVSLHRLALEERMLDVVRALGLTWPNICTRPVLYFNSPRLAKKEVYWRVFPHQDWRSMQGSLDSVVLWAPLIDLPSELGPLEVIPGSHLDGLVTDGVEDGFGKVPDTYLNTRSFESLPCQAGDIVAFSSFLVHRSGTNSSPQVRWSCHFRYNNLAEPTFVERGYPHPYLYKPTEELLTAAFPTRQQVCSALAKAA